MSAYRDALGWLLTDALETLSPLRLALPDDAGGCRELVVEREQQTSRLFGLAYTDPGHNLSVRYCRSQSRKFDVAMLMIFPTAAPHRLPVVGAEWVVVGDRCHMAGFDVHPAGPQPELDAELDAVYSPLGTGWRSALPPNHRLPPWASELGRPWGVFTTGPLSILGPTRSAFQAYLEIAVEQFYRPRAATHRGGDAPAVAAYKAHHCRHSPGRPLLARTFGPEQADEFIEWHFGPAPMAAPPPRDSAGCPPS